MSKPFSISTSRYSDLVLVDLKLAFNESSVSELVTRLRGITADSSQLKLKIISHKLNLHPCKVSSNLEGLFKTIRGLNFK